MHVCVHQCIHHLLRSLRHKLMTGLYSRQLQSQTQCHIHCITSINRADEKFVKLQIHWRPSHYSCNIQKFKNETSDFFLDST